MSGKKKSSVRIKTQKNVNSYGYDVSNFGVLDMSVLRSSNTGRFTSVKTNTGPRVAKKVSKRTST